MRTFSADELVSFMEISSKLADLNRQRFQEWHTPFTKKNAAPAFFAFSGDVYDGLEAESLSSSHLTFAQKHIRILSGLYGSLRPLDLIQPYRLEMGRPLATGSTKNLYEFWRTTLTEEINNAPGDRVINLASQEYFKVLDLKQLNKTVITPTFKDEKNGQLKIISFYAKKARGMMARHIITRNITDADGLLSFSANGYQYSPELSTPAKPVFTRAEGAHD